MNDIKNENKTDNIGTTSNNSNLKQVEVPNQTNPNIASPSQESINQPPPFQPSQPAQTTEDPGKTLGIIGLVLAIIGMSVVGLVLCIIGYKKSKAVGMKNTIALVGIWLNAIPIVLVFVGILLALLIAAFSGATK